MHDETCPALVPGIASWNQDSHVGMVVGGGGGYEILCVDHRWNMTLTFTGPIGSKQFQAIVTNDANGTALFGNMHRQL